jgi:hypothetical protein
VRVFWNLLRPSNVQLPRTVVTMCHLFASYPLVSACVAIGYLSCIYGSQFRPFLTGVLDRDGIENLTRKKNVMGLNLTFECEPMGEI